MQLDQEFYDREVPEDNVCDFCGMADDACHCYDDVDPGYDGILREG